MNTSRFRVHDRLTAFAPRNDVLGVAPVLPRNDELWLAVI
jgi:hypothetical protein